MAGVTPPDFLAVSLLTVFTQSYVAEILYPQTLLKTLSHAAEASYCVTAHRGLSFIQTILFSPPYLSTSRQT